MPKPSFLQQPPAARHHLAWPWALALLACAVLLRLALLGGQAPISFPDTATYIEAARDLVSGDYSIGQARRTPGYPALVALLGESGNALMQWQQVAGVASSLLLFAITLRITQRPGLAFAVGLGHSLNLQQLFMESLLLTESLTAFCVMATLWALLLACRRLAAGRAAVAWLLLSGLLGALSVMVRPQFIFFLGLLPLLAGYAAQGWRPGGRALAAAAWVLTPMLAAVLAWSALVQAKVGTFTVSTQSGFGLVNHIHDELEYAPAEFALVRDIMIRTRNARVAEVGNGFNTVWYSWPEVHRATGWTVPQASVQYKRMSLAIMARRPLQYANTVTRAWLAYWTVPNLWEPERIAPPALRRALEAVWWVEHKLLRLANALFVLLVAAVVAIPAVRRRLQWDLALSALAGTVLLSSVLQALADHGSNSRYAMPTQTLVVVVLMLAAARW